MKRYEIGAYRCITHCRTFIVEAESSDEARDAAYKALESNVDDDVKVGWKYQRTELRISYVQGELGGKPRAGSCNDGAAADAEGEDSSGPCS